MEKLLEWMRGIVLLFFLLSALLYFVPREVYKKYIRFFMEMILILAILFPVIKLFYDGDSFEKMVHYDEFWQEISGLQTDMEHMEYLQNEYYVKQYEQAIETDIQSMTEEYGYKTKQVNICLNAGYEMEQITLCVEPEKKMADTGKTEEEALADLKGALLDFYRTDEEHVKISVQ